MAAADIQTLAGETPEPPYFSAAGRKDKGDYIGKPKSKTKTAAMRFSVRDYEEIKRKAEYAGMNFTQFVTAASLGKRIAVIDGLDKVLKEQKGIGRNLNQLTALCNMGKIFAPDLQEIKKQYASVCKILCEIERRCS